MKYGIEIANKIDVVYTNYCKSLCHDLNLNQTAFDILMFLANNPEYSSAKDIVNVRKIKANLVSINIDKLVKLGYLKRKHVSNDRRKVQLCLTDKATEIIENGRKVQLCLTDKATEIIENGRKVQLCLTDKATEIIENGRKVQLCLTDKATEIIENGRKVQLCLTDKATEIIENGRKVQDEFVKNLLEGIDEDTISTVQKAFQKMEENMERMGKE